MGRVPAGRSGGTIDQDPEWNGVSAQDQSRVLADHRVECVEGTQHDVKARVLSVRPSGDLRCLQARLGLGGGCLLMRPGHRHARVAVGGGANFGGDALTLGHMLCRDGLPLGPHPRHRRGQGFSGQGQALDTHLTKGHAVAAQDLIL